MGPYHPIMRRPLRAIACLLLLLFLPCATRADSSPVARSHALAVLGEPALPDGCPYFPYVNPDAPKGGSVTLATVGAP